jgi:hypothetical protein
MKSLSPTVAQLCGGNAVGTGNESAWNAARNNNIVVHSFFFSLTKDVKVFTDVEATVSGEAVAAMWDGCSEAEQEAAAGGAAGAAAAK